MLITCGSAGESRAIARHLVQNQLAAGVQIVPIESVYTWEGEVVEDDELLLICKTRRDRYLEIESTVRGMHSYEVVPIFMLEMSEGSRPYLDWIDDATAGA